MSGHYIYSTLSQPQAYTLYQKSGNDIPQKVGSVLIHGGANIADKNLVTPYGAVTKITDEQLEMLQESRHFKDHERLGYIRVSKSNIDPNKAAEDMTGKDKSAQKTPEEMIEEGAVPEEKEEKKKPGRKSKR